MTEQADTAKTVLPRQITKEYLDSELAAIPASLGPRYSSEFSTEPPSAVKREGGKVVERANLQEGDDGFLMAEFADGHIARFSLANLSLQA